LEQLHGAFDQTILAYPSRGCGQSFDSRADQDESPRPMGEWQENGSASFKKYDDARQQEAISAIPIVSRE
jgi:hypothetical protein